MKKIMKWISLAIATLSLSAFMVACAPSSIEKGKAKMVEDGYSVGDFPTVATGCVGAFYASEGLLSEDKMIAYLFESTDAAKAFYEDLGEDNATLKGKWVLTGSADAIEDFLG